MNRRQLFAGMGAAALAAPALLLAQPGNARSASCPALDVDKGLADPWPLSSTGDVIEVAEHTVYVPGGRVVVPAGWVTGLAPGTRYDVWYLPDVDGHLAVDMDRVVEMTSVVINHWTARGSVYLGRVQTCSGARAMARPVSVEVLPLRWGA